MIGHEISNFLFIKVVGTFLFRWSVNNPPRIHFVTAQAAGAGLAYPFKNRYIYVIVSTTP